jgi:hypothetical protein
LLPLRHFLLLLAAAPTKEACDPLGKLAHCATPRLRLACHLSPGLLGGGILLSRAAC